MSSAIGGSGPQYGQATMAQSVPVTLASDQTNISTTLTAFTPNPAVSGVLSLTTNASGIGLSTSNLSLSLYNVSSTAPAFIRFGTAPTAVLTDLCVPPITRMIVGTGGATSVSAIATSTTSMYYTGGNGL